MAKRKKTAHEPAIHGYLVGYARVSTEDQNLDLQIDALKRAGVKDDNLHIEKVSGAAKNRPALEFAIKDLREGDTFVVWRLDRLARNMRDLFARLDRITAKGANFKSLTENFDMSTAMGRLYLHIAGAFAEFERQLIAQRTAAGIQAYRERSGKAWGPDRIMTEDKIKEAGRLLNKEYLSGPEVARKMGVSTASIYAHWRAVKTKDGRKFVRKVD